MKKTQKKETILIDTKEVAVVKAQATKALNYSTSLAVESKEDYAAALEEGKRIKDILDKMTARKEEITRPLNEALKSARSLFKPIEDVLGTALSNIRNKMTVYHKDQLAEAKKAEEKVVAKVDSGYLKPETGMKKLGEIINPEKTVISASAQAVMKTVQKWRVIDKTKIPLEFMEPDMVAIKRSFKEGKPVAGVEQYEEQELAIS